MSRYGKINEPVFGKAEKNVPQLARGEINIALEKQGLLPEEAKKGRPSIDDEKEEKTRIDNFIKNKNP